MKVFKIFAIVAMLAALPTIVSADTVFTGGDLTTVGNWTGGFPSMAGDPVGIIAVDGTYSVTSFTAATFTGSTINHTAGNITVGIANSNFNYVSTGSTWNMSGGTHSTRGLLANGTTINLSGGTMTLGTTTNTSVGFGVNGNATVAGNLNISGSVVVNSLQQFGISNTKTVAGPAGVFEFKSDWTGSITNPGFTTLTDWETAVLALGSTTTSAPVTYEGTQITSSALFNSTFQITNGGQTLSLKAVPEPTSLVVLGAAMIGLVVRRRRS